eukprot:CAMPEP_0201107408 /NCGR_PEP_ID=MMETSP0812-20130820/56373_1 /ASSEMBLY_ACC=CAM_ASM_000668 /TAXON_ID=98059 /ORGANISM="Dinobryon sp., Strain UTEXLB2267" /LENGTH=46 /DNA_ID= /DNA_START= /DNA_END= /DNA_ORIENTATION=
MMTCTLRNKNTLESTNVKYYRMKDPQKDCPSAICDGFQTSMVTGLM